jgi:outer membrane lipoprotein-sorting protein
MLRLWAVLLFSLIDLSLAAQPKGYQILKDSETFRQALAKVNAGRQTITSDFTQTKHLSLLEDKVKSKGRFFFRKQDQVRLEYTAPYAYLLIMNSGQILVRDGEKTSRINTRNSRMLQSVNRIIIDCMQGSVFRNPDFSVAVYENNNGYLLSLTPVQESMRQMFRQIEVYMDKKNLDVTRLTMTEAGGDFTDMDFVNTRHNLPLDDALFKIR